MWQVCTPQLITDSPHRADDDRSSTNPSSQVLGLPFMPRVEQREDKGEDRDIHIAPLNASLQCCCPSNYTKRNILV